MAAALEFRAVASGFCFLEAPRADGDAVWFTDVIQGASGASRRTAGSTRGHARSDVAGLAIGRTEFELASGAG